MATPSAKTRVSLSNILYATDFSSIAGAAVPYAAEIARRYGGRVHAVHVRSIQAYGIAPPESWPALKEAAEVQAKEEAERLDRLFQGVEHDSTVTEGDVWEVLSRLIDEKHADLIVMGTHGREGLGKILLGSIAENVLRRAACPVLTVGPRVLVSPERAVEMKRILFPTDFSAASQAAAAYAISLAQENQAYLDLLHVIEKRKTGELVLAQELVPGTKGRMRALLPPEADLWCEPTYLVEEGDPAESILKPAKEHGADMIVLGVKRLQGGFSPAARAPCATAHKIIVGAPCPVLTVHG